MLFIHLSAYLLVFAILSLLTFYLPGYVYVRKLKKDLESWEIITLSFVLGIIQFLFLTLLLGIINFRDGIYIILLLLISYGLIKFRLSFLEDWKFLFREKVLFSLVSLGILVLGFINFPSGLLYSGGLYFWSSQGFDGLWHVALMEEAIKSFPPQIPTFAGEKLVNYHYFTQLIMGEFNRIYPFFSSLDLYFRFFPVVWAFLIGISVFSFVNRWQDNKVIGYWAMFFTFFVGSFGYIVKFLHEGIIFGGENIFWAAQINTILGNPPHAVAISLLVNTLLLILLYLKTNKKVFLILAFLIAATLAGFKVSGGMVLLAGLGALGVINILFKRRPTIFALFILLLSSNYLVIKLITKGAETFLIFQPWWFIRTMVVAPDRLDWIDLEHRRQHYLSVGRWTSYLRVVQVEATAFLIFLIGNLGTRFIGLFEVFRKIIFFKKVILNEQMDIILIVSMLTAFLIPLLFVQSAIAYSGIQFMQYFLLITGFYASITVYKFFQLIKIKYIEFLLTIFLISFSVPTVIGNFVEFYGRPPLSKISKVELKALEYIKENTNSDIVILSIPYNQYSKDKYKSQPFPIHVWYKTAYISAISSRRTYLASEDNVDQAGFPMEQRREKIVEFLKQEDFKRNKKFLKEEGIDLVYLRKDELESPFDPNKNGLVKYFENEEVLVYKVAL